MILLLIIAIVWALGSTAGFFVAAVANHDIARENRALQEHNTELAGALLVAKGQGGAARPLRKVDL